LNILSLENVSKNYGLKPLFQGVSMGVDERDRIGIIGANGSGKSTLLRVISGQEIPDEGSVVVTEGTAISFLPQNPVFDSDATVLETVFKATGGLSELLRAYESACHDLEIQGGTDEALLAKVSDLGHELESAGAWEIETNAKTVLTRLGITDVAAPMGTLSGGQRKRVALASSLIGRPDLLILDEPTNHLDADTIEWLESHLARYSGALLLVTHDRYFLDRVTNRIVELDRGAVQRFDGSYSYYLEKKEEQEASRAAEGQKEKMLIRKELAWLRRGAKARTRKSKSRVEAAEELIAKPKEVRQRQLDISVVSRRLGTKIVELENISKSYGERELIRNFDYQFSRTDRIGIIGPNGSGKTTLLDIITGRIPVDNGDVRVGETVVFGYYDQESRELNEEQRVIDYIREIAEQVQTPDGNWITASQMLERFLFPRTAQYSVIGKLSGGERRRLYLLRVLMGQPNVLLLDEPTNDLDIPTLMALEEYLDDFNGVLINVSHDRYFLDRTIDVVFRFNGKGEIRKYPGDYSTYLEFRDRENEEASARARQAAPPPTSRSKEEGKGAPAANRKLSYKEARELEELEKRIESSEARLAEVEILLNQNASDAGMVQQLFLEQESLQSSIQRDIERWSELAERNQSQT
jgi:ATP-binding cassette subfamily F protein uup